MKLLKKRKFAILLTIIVAIIATMIGVYSTSVRYTRDVEAMFYSGVEHKGEGYTQPGISSHLDNCVNAALNLATVLEKYPELAGKSEDLLSARRDLLAAVKISDKSSAYINMRTAFNDLLNAAVSVDLTERDMTATAQHFLLFNGAANAMSNSRYNEEVVGYLNGRSALMRFIGTFVPTREPEFFSTVVFGNNITWPSDFPVSP